jgi:cardiolipin synthase
MTDTSWKFYKTSEEAWQAMFLAIEEAKESIDLEQYIFFFDSIGRMFLEALSNKAQQGVKVRLFCDSVGSYSFIRSGAAKELEKAGVKITFFNPVTPWHPNNESLWYFRDHRKLIVIDKRIGFTGGVCLGADMRGWRDSHVRIEGPVISDMVHSFEIMWGKAYRNVRFLLKKQRRLREDENLPFRYLTSAPLPGKRYLYRELIRAIKSAKSYIYLTTPYLLPDSRLLRSLKAAVRRGVEVRILVPVKANILIVDIGMQTFFSDLLSNGIRIHQYGAALLHGKTGVIDGSWSTIGSLNLDNLSLRYNFEGNIVSRDKTFASELEEQFKEDLLHSVELTLSDWQRRPFFHKILEILVWPVRKFL